MGVFPIMDGAHIHPEEIGHLGVGCAEAAELFSLLGVFWLVGIGALLATRAGPCSAVPSRHAHGLNLPPRVLPDCCANCANSAKTPEVSRFGTIGTNGTAT